MLTSTQVFIWRFIAVVSLVLGVIGVALPIMPTAPFLILAAWAGGKGWPALEAWLLSHPRYGDHIRRWRERGAISRKTKIVATAMMLTSSLGLQFTTAPQWAQVGVPMCMALVALWLWMRPET
jgi:uncharacterized membrane protein YbaN (DUF454 family)